MNTFLRRRIHEYLAENSDMSSDERSAFQSWIASGHDPYDNPYMLYDDSGVLMDFIAAIRIVRESES